MRLKQKENENAGQPIIPSDGVGFLFAPAHTAAELLVLADNIELNREKDGPYRRT